MLLSILFFSAKIASIPKNNAPNLKAPAAPAAILVALDTLTPPTFVNTFEGTEQAAAKPPDNGAAKYKALEILLCFLSLTSLDVLAIANLRVFISSIYAKSSKSSRGPLNTGLEFAFANDTELTCIYTPYLSHFNYIYIKAEIIFFCYFHNINT